jgi:hypothetical protein
LAFVTFQFLYRFNLSLTGKDDEKAGFSQFLCRLFLPADSDQYQRASIHLCHFLSWRKCTTIYGSIRLFVDRIYPKLPDITAIRICKKLAICLLFFVILKYFVYLYGGFCK